MSDRKLQIVPRRVTRTLLASICAIAVAAVQGQQLNVPKPSGDREPASPVTGVATGLVSSPSSAATAAEIQRINEHMALLQAQLNELELQARISNKRKEIESAATSAGTASAFDSKAGLPSVQSVAGLKGRLEAVLVFPGGFTQRVKAGDVVDDRRVTTVSLNEVVLTDLQGRKVQRLAFGGAPAVRENTQATGTVPTLPAYAPPVPGR